MIVNLLISMLGPRFDEEQAQVFARIGQWVVLHERNGRMLVDAVGQRGMIQQALAMLNQAGRAPISLGAWHQDGTPVQGHPLNEAAWLEVAPDDFDMTDPENPIPTRPTQWREIHRWQGWEPKQITTTQAAKK